MAPPAEPDPAQEVADAHVTSRPAPGGDGTEPGPEVVRVWGAEPLEEDVVYRLGHGRGVMTATLSAIERITAMHSTGLDMRETSIVRDMVRWALGQAGAP
jgi:hypothetical protein